MTDDKLSVAINDHLHRLIATIDIEGAPLADQRSKELGDKWHTVFIKYECPSIGEANG
jgi:hypothetical protein